MEVSNITIPCFLANEQDSLELIDRNWQKVPLLNANEVQNLQNNKLVRFRGMVQDMFSPEYYFEKYEVLNEATNELLLRDGRYKDASDYLSKEVINAESSNNVTSQRNTLVVISVPGLNQWVKDIENKQHRIPTEKVSTSTSPINQVKRTHEDDTDVAIEGSPESSKKQCTSSSQPSTSTTESLISKEYLLNFPFPDRGGKACHMKFYKSTDDVKLNDLIECIGFLSVDPCLAVEDSSVEDNGDTTMEVQTHNPPPSLIPRIHVVSYRKFKDYNPLYDVEKEPLLSIDTIQFLRKELHIILTQLLFGDELAAEYLIYHLMSRIYLRKDFMALGKFSLNISNIPCAEVSKYGEVFYEFLEQLLAKSHYVAMTLDNMNDLTFIPKKDYDCNRITSGLLQLSEGTHLIIDETVLSAGKLNESGVRAVGAISNIIKNQKVAYDFNFYTIDYDCDIPCLVLSERKSMLPSDCHIPLQLDPAYATTFSEIVEAAKVYLKPELLDPLRTYLSVRRHAKYELSDEIQEIVQKEFLNMRQSDTSTSADDLHNLLVLARLVCLTEGKSVLDEACWKRACALEVDRKARFVRS